MSARIAIVGRPNVGKSTLFNRMVGGRPALVHDRPGLTRDRRYGEVDYFGAHLDVIDTGGLDPSAEGEVIGAGIHRQAWRAIEEADALLLVVDGSAGLAPLDAEVARQVRATGKPILLAVNKIDGPKRDPQVGEFFGLGLGQPYAVSAAHGRGVDAMLEALVALLGVTPEPVAEDDDAEVDGEIDDRREGDPEFAEAEDELDVAADDDDDGDEDDGDEDDSDEDADAEDDSDDADSAAEDVVAGDDAGAATDDAGAPHEPRHHKPERKAWRRPADRESRDREMRADNTTGPVRIAFLGKPNAGKSSLTNRLLGEERSLVHHEPGTTTDPVDSPLTFGGRDYVLVDTAGIRRKARIEDDVEKLAVSMALGQIERADVVVLVIDATLGPSEQDARLAGAIAEHGKALVLALNKSDLLRGAAAGEALKQAVKDNFHFLTWAPSVMLSAVRGDGVDRLMDAVNQVAAQHRRRISTAEINRFFAEVCEVVPPPIWRGKAVRIHYITQAAVRPPSFVLMTNAPQGVSPAYQRFLTNQLRKRYGFRGTPLRIFTRARADRHKQ
jgi:GTP-binding protein